MATNETYFDYPHRSAGYDHSLYPLRYLRKAPKVDFGDGTKLALWVTCGVDFFPLNMHRTQPFTPTGGVWRPYPDIWTYSTRDYGNRWGIYRLMSALSDKGIKPTAFVQGEAAARMPQLMDDLAKAGTEFAAGGWSMGDIHATPMPQDVEEELIARTSAALSPWAAPADMGWHSPESSETKATPDLVKAGGYRWIADWMNDDMPYDFSNGLKAMPLSYDMNDVYMIFKQNQTVAQWATQIEYAADALLTEAKTYGGRILNLSLSPWVTGQPYRIAAVEALLSALLGRTGVKAMTASEILSATGRAGLTA